MPKLTFSGHESFTCRQLWLKKGYDFLKQGYSFSSPDAVVHLGVGKNMVSSIHYWMKSFNLIDETGQLQTLAGYLLDTNGKDPYLEKAGTLWLLHYLIVKSGRATVYGLAFNDFRREHTIFTRQQFINFLVKHCENMGVTISSESLQRDVDVFIRSYVQPQRKTQSIEDDFATLLIDTNLLHTQQSTKNEGGIHYLIERQKRADIPVQVFLFAILDCFQGNSVAFRSIANDQNSPGMIFALSDDGLLDLINELTTMYPDIIYTDDAGIREIQFRTRPDPMKVLNDYYDG